MPAPKYDSIAPTYHERYRARSMDGIAASLQNLVVEGATQRALEAGCGTGRWLVELKKFVPQVIGFDLSMGMLRKGRELDPALQLACGQAAEFPFPAYTFDLVFCVNAFHHFPEPGKFIESASRLLRPGGILALIGMDPHRGRDRWYLYHYFSGTFETDLRRFPSGGQILDWMTSTGFRKVQWGIAEHIYSLMRGDAVLEDPFLKKNGTSQLVLLSDHDYAQGMQHIRRDLREAQRRGEEIVFPVDIELTCIAGTMST